MRKSFALALITSCLLSSLAFCQSKTAYSKETEATIKQVEENLCSWAEVQGELPWALQDRMKFYRINGVSIAVVKDYKIAWAKGYGLADVAESRNVDETTLFQAASISKSLNAVGVMKLVQEKKLDLTTDINNSLKSWKFPYDSISKGKKITLANLLSHTGGLTVHGFPGYTTTETLPATKDILDGKAPANNEAVRSVTEPGAEFSYSGGGITITQLMVTDVTGQPYAAYMWDNVLKPLGMLQSSYEQPTLKANNLLATGYTMDGSKITGSYHVYPEQAAAGLWTNPTDLCHYIIEMQLAYAGKSARVLNKQSVHTMLTPAENAGESGLGVFINKKGGDSYFQHGGANEGFRCQYYGSLENGNGVVIMVNSDNGNIMNEVLNSVAKVYKWNDFYVPEKKTVVTVPENILDEYLGMYGNEEVTFSIVKLDGSLWLELPDSSTRLYFTSDTKFFRHENRNSPEFIKDADGKVTGIKFNDSFFTAKL
jgi:CubicO group peptidase (beta-lactamase class C family)